LHIAYIFPFFEIVNRASGVSLEPNPQTASRGRHRRAGGRAER
jgi:hypothetical protein